MLIPDIKKRLKKIPTNRVGILVQEWNIKYPLDRWFREKHSIVWGSSRHRETIVLSILFEFEEDRAYRKLYDEIASEKKVEEKKYVPGDWYGLKDFSIESEETEDLFNLIDISLLEEDTEGNIILDK